GRHTAREPADVAALPRRRVGADRAGAAGGDHRPVPRPAAVLPAGVGRVHQLSPARRAASGAAGRRDRRRIMTETLVAILAAAIAAGTPLVYAALGELITERSGVLNLGVEGMMLVGAVAGFAATVATGNPWAG